VSTTRSQSVARSDATSLASRGVVRCVDRLEHVPVGRLVDSRQRRVVRPEGVASDCFAR